MNAITPINRTAPLSDLSLHAFNPRQDHDADDIAALARSIAINGLMQNLSVYDENGTLGVVAGGRRLRALEHLRDTGVDIEGGVQIDFDAIPIITTDDPTYARSWAGTEGATQRPLNPADEIRAYGAMAEQGMDAQTIAMAFGQRLAHVKGRLALSGLSTQALGALREGKITLDVAKVMTLCNDAKQADTALELAVHQRFSAHQLRNRLMDGNVSATDRRVVYIGLDLYRAEGGTLDEDLFGDSSRLHNEDLIDTLFKAKLIKAAEDEQAAGGWGKVVPVMESGGVWNHTNGMHMVYRKPVALPEADQARLDELYQIDGDGEFTNDEYAECEALEDRKRGDYSDEDRAAGTVFIYVDYHDKLTVSDLYLPNASRGDDDSSDATPAQPAPKPPITQGGIADLQRIERISLQAKMLDQSELVLDLLAFQLWHEMPSFAAPFNIMATDQLAEPSATDSVHITPRLTGADDDPAQPFGSDVAAAFEAFVDKGKKHRNTVLTTMLARTMNAPFSSPLGAAMLDKLGISPRDVWTPTAANFFNACRSELLDSIWRQLVITDDTADDMAKFTKLKVGKKREELEALFHDTSVQEALALSRDQIAAIDAWLPDPMMREVAE